MMSQITCLKPLDPTTEIAANRGTGFGGAKQTSVIQFSPYSDLEVLKQSFEQTLGIKQGSGGFQAICMGTTAPSRNTKTFHVHLRKPSADIGKPQLVRPRHHRVQRLRRPFREQRTHADHGGDMFEFVISGGYIEVFMSRLHRMEKACLASAE